MSFGIRHTFRTQHISRKIARANQQDNKDEEKVTNLTNISSDSDNVFESNKNFVSNVLNRSVQKPISSNSISISASSTSSTSSLSDNDSYTRTSKGKNSNLVSARLNLLKNHNKGVTRSEDHL